MTTSTTGFILIAAAAAFLLISLAVRHTLPITA